LPVIVIGADIVRSEPAIPVVRPGAEAEIAREAILARSRRRRQRTALVQEQPPRRLDGRPLGCFPPDFGVHAEIVHSRLARQTGIEIHQVSVEEPEQLAVERKFGNLGATPGRHVDARAVIPWWSVTESMA
jgi:hypothetical protein